MILLASTLYRPSMSWGLIVLVLAAVIFSGLLTAHRERQYWPLVLRVVAVLALGWVLLGHSQARPGIPGDATPPRLSVLIDWSESMAEQDAVVSPDTPAASRIKAVSDAYLSDEALAKLRAIAEVELLPFDEQLRPNSPYWLSPTGKSTALYRVVAQTNADATLILSDGHDTTRQSLPGDLSSAGRVFAVPVGTPRSAPDLGLQAWPDSDRLFEDQSTTITASIRHSGFKEQQAIVELLHEGKTIETMTLTLDQRSAIARFTVTPPLEAGRTMQANHYTARVRPANGDEAYPDNNAGDIFIQTSRGQVKVLLLEGEPYWDTRSLARLVTSHPRFDLTALYAYGKERRSRLIGQTIDPTTDPVVQLDTFDIVILGRQVQRLVDKGFGDRLVDYVRGGGAVVFARGQPSAFEAGQDFDDWFAMTQKIDSVSPVNWAEPVLGEMRVRLGDADDPRGPLAGLQEGEVLTRLPGMLAATRIDGRKTASLVLLEQQSQDGPVMAAMTSLRVGSGVSLAVLTEGLWRWELLPGVDEQDSEVESIYGVLWVRALQWLASGGEFLPGQDIALEADRVTAELSQPINLKISTRYVETNNVGLRLTATHSDGTSEQLTPMLSDTAGTYTAMFTPQQTGVYTVRLTTPGRPDLVEADQPLTTRLAVIERSPERRDTSARPEALKQLVEPTGGQCLDLGEIAPLIDYLQSLQALRGSEDTVDYAFNIWPVFALIAGCLGLEWIIRRRMGLR
ncbi:MAG: hypothetical protein KTR15_15070 [Phycisphaeraceae bacterium]|nr:hypothetical protein [Phycisphaeraceae bacterium]